ncbi:zinc ribbon domain-containing protein [Bacillus sp. DX1.1]|uniref:zinc ribbon domain-containing protein n=1 Tax=unclassified Bacillus (in: firmicutes) TaxID=185979 RepID=UPI00256FAE39|nr:MULTISPECIES: zinc ribbon domain-containing protein [unclassified Bacillus (in: firmicutes)]MDM5157309.1 zinc ribbon domain-containing protein [Bacillus sp. DX1.1]WJE81536.1 zinc ribbon domain-containing protein [Bacillus sp. DX3.1]
MYCRMCGNQHGEEVNYCPSEGSMMVAASDAVVLEQDKSKYCRGCGNENAQHNLYCQTCGHSLFAVTKKEHIAKLPSMENGSKVGLALHKGGLRTGIIGGAIASILMLLVGWIGSLVFSEMMEKIFHEFASDLKMLPDFYASTTSTLLSYHLLGFSAGDEGGIILSLSWHTPFFLLLIIPFITLCGVGIWIGKQQVAKTIGEQIVTAATVGIIYGLFLFVISFIASKSVAIPEIGTVTVGYSSFKSLLSGFMYGTLFSLFGLIAHTGRNNIADVFQELLPYGASLYYGMAAMVKGFLLTAVIFCVTTLVALSDGAKPLDDLAPTTSQRALIALQLTPNVWSMTHLAPVEIKIPELQKELSKISTTGDKSVMEFSFVSGMSVGGVGIKDILIAEGAPPLVMESFDEINSKFHLGLLLLIIPFFFMFRVGQKLAKMPSSNMYVTLAVCSGAYTIMMIMMNILSEIQIDIKGNATELFGMSGTMLSMQNSFMYLILGSFILTYAAAFVGMKLAKK